MMTKEEFIKERGWEEVSKGRWSPKDFYGEFLTLDEAYRMEKKDFLNAVAKEIMVARQTLDAPHGYSHNVINLALLLIDKTLGRSEANHMLRRCRLHKVGWVEEPESNTRLSEYKQPNRLRAVDH